MVVSQALVQLYLQVSMFEQDSLEMSTEHFHLL